MIIRNRIHIMKPTPASFKQQNIFIKILFGICCLFILGFTPEGTVRIFLIGDSTMADKPLIDNPEHGWGQMFPLFFKEGVQIFNHAKNGRSTKNFIAQGRWNAVYNQLKPGDYVFIQFGHNDAKKDDTLRFALPRPDYKNNLKKFIAEAREKQAIPILLTSITRRDFDLNGKLKATHGEYPDVMKEVAKEKNVPLIDMFEKTKYFISHLGDGESKRFYLAGVDKKEFRLWNNKRDDTHFTRIGAVKMASFVVDGIKELNLNLVEKLIEPISLELMGEGKVVGLDYSLNQYWKFKKDSSKSFTRYAWEDSSHYGFSQLGSIIDRLGANLDTLQSLPTDSLLNYLSIYIVINTASNEMMKQNNIDYDKVIKIINAWVERGGVLVLLENNEGSSESEYFNELAENFGIEFIKNNAEMIYGKTYETKAHEHLPSHKIFNNVQKLYAEDVSALKIKSHAITILKDNNSIIIASVKFGKGLILAMGNSWLLNEHIDLQQLVTKEENGKAAKNLFEWLLALSQNPMK